MIIRELNTLIREANYLLVFVPVINYVYLSSLKPSKKIFVLAGMSCVISAFVLNFTRGYPDEGDEPSSDSLPTIANVIYILSLGVWMILWIYSVLRLHGSLGNFGPNVLFFGSLAWGAMLSIHIGLDRMDAYDNPMYDF